MPSSSHSPLTPADTTAAGQPLPGLPGSGPHRPPDARAAAALDLVDAVPRVPLFHAATPVDEARRLRARLDLRPRLFIKRDDAIPFGAGGNKVRKMELMGARALAEGADTLVTSGGVQSNHCRVTAAVAARLGMRCELIVNGDAPAAPTGNALLVRLFDARVSYVPTRAAPAARVEEVLGGLRAAGRRPFAIPLGASTPLGALGYVRAVGELVRQIPPPDVIIHASSSAGTQAGLMAGCALHGLKTRVIGVSADDPAREIAGAVRMLLAGIAGLLHVDPATLLDREVVVDDRFIGEGYGVPTAASTEAAALAATCEGLPVDPVYGAKALAALVARARQGGFDDCESVLFWHTGGVPGLFA